MTFDILKKKLQAEIDVSNAGDVRIYNFLKNELLYGDESTADEFMLSKHGGYSEGELNKIKLRASYLSIKNKQRSMISGNAF